MKMAWGLPVSDFLHQFSHGMDMVMLLGRAFCCQEDKPSERSALHKKRRRPALWLSMC